MRHTAPQFLSVLRLLAEDKQGSIEDVMSVDVSSLMHSLAEFIARYDEPASHRIKIKFCQLCKSICERTDILTMRKDNVLRHDILDIVLEWLQPGNVSTLAPPSLSAKLSQLLDARQWERTG